MLFRKKTNLEKHFGILFSARLYRTDVETYNIQRERDGYTYIWVIFFIDGLENNLHELLYYNIFLVYPPFAYAIRSLAHMELLSCHGPRQPLEGAHGHMSSVLLHVAWFHIQLDSKTYSKGSSQWRLRFLILSEHHRFPKLLSHCYRVSHFFLPVFFSGFSPLSERTDAPSARSDFSPLSEPPALLPSLRVPSSVDEVVGLVCPRLAISSCSLKQAFILVIQLFRSSCRSKRVWRLHVKKSTWINVMSYHQDCTESARGTP